MRRGLRWSDLRVGAVALAASGLAALAIFFSDRIADRLAYPYALRIHAPSARSLAPGAPVWVAGVPAGRVTAVRFRGPETPVEERVAIEVRLRRRVRPILTAGTHARVVTAGTLGETVVDIVPGPAAGPPLPDGALLSAGAPVDVNEVWARLDEVRRAWPEVRARWRELRHRWARAPHARALLDPRGPLARVARGLAELRAALDPGPGAPRTLVRDPRPLFELAAVLGRLEAVAAAASRGTLGRIAGGGLPERWQEIGARWRVLDAQLDRAEGTAGRFLHDRELALQLERLRRALETLRADAEAARRPPPDAP